MDNIRTNKKALQRNHTMTMLIEAALPIFREKGFENAKISEITEAANVGIGSLNNCFGNMERLGAFVRLVLLRHVVEPVRARLTFEEDPILYVLTILSANLKFMTREGGYRQFFLDLLKHDLIFNYLLHAPNCLTERLVRVYKPDADRDLISLYSEYMPYMLGRTILLKKQEGMFANIPLDELPFLMCRESLNYFIPEEEIRKRVPESLKIAEELVESLPDKPSMELIEAIVRERSAHL